MFGILLKNLAGYDLIILLLAVFNAAVIYPKVKQASQMLKNKLQPKIYVPVSLLMERMKERGAEEPGGGGEGKLDLHALIAMRSDEIHYYSIFSAINSAFPLLGMLGTILSLLGMVDLSQQDVTLSFTVALTSTFWGLLCALGFKAVDAVLAPMVEQNQENLKMLLERLDHFEEWGIRDEA